MGDTHGGRRVHTASVMLTCDGRYARGKVGRQPPIMDRWHTTLSLLPDPLVDTSSTPRALPRAARLRVELGAGHGQPRRGPGSRARNVVVCVLPHPRRRADGVRAGRTSVEGRCESIRTHAHARPQPRPTRAATCSRSASACLTSTALSTPSRGARQPRPSARTSAGRGRSSSHGAAP